MCGFSGVFSKNKLIDEASILQSLKSIKHRGPNDTLIAQFNDEKFKLFSTEISSSASKEKYPNSSNLKSNNFIGFNRLSVVDLSSNGMQPIFSEDRKIAFMMNGEIYNYLDIKNNYLKNETFHSQTDTEVAFKLYQKLGDNFIHELRGMFAIVVIDYTKNQVKIWRDRFGIKPFFYHLTNENFVFSSEMKGIFSTNLVQKKVDPKQLAYLFYLSTNFAPNTLYHNINSLEPATKLTLNLDDFTIEKEVYWRLEYEENKVEICKDEFISDLRKVSKLATTGDVKQAIMLSGGLDSGILAKLVSPEIDQAFSIYNEQIDSLNEIHFARLNAQNAKVNLIPIEIPNKVNNQELIDYATSEEEPNTSPEPTYFLSKKAHEKEFTVLYNALGLDELFYGYDYYIRAKKLNKIEGFYKSLPLEKILKSGKSYKLKEVKNLGLETIGFVNRSHTSWENIKELFVNYDSKNWSHPAENIMKLVRETQPNFDNFPLLKKISWLDFYYYIGSHHSFRSDQPAMKFCIEMRFPFLDHLFVQKYFNSKNLDQNLSFKNNKPFLRKNISELMNKEIFNMPKKGFSMPTNEWLQNFEQLDKTTLYNYFGEKNLRKFESKTTIHWQLFSIAQFLKNEK